MCVLYAFLKKILALDCIKYSGIWNINYVSGDNKTAKGEFMKKSKDVLKGFAVLLLAVLFITACGGKTTAQSGGSGKGVLLTEQDFKYDMTKDGKGVKLLAYIGDKGGNLIIPDTIEGIPVLALGDIDEEFGAEYFIGFAEKSEEARQKQLTNENPQTKERGQYVANEISFYGTKNRKDRITSVKIPDTVIIIGRGAFEGCEALKTITFPRDLKIISIDAFKESGLTAVTIPAGVKVNYSAFYNNKSLTTVTLGENVQVHENVFSNCIELSNVTIPSVITYFYMGRKQTRPAGTLSGAFFNCPKLSLATRKAIQDSGYVEEF